MQEEAWRDRSCCCYAGGQREVSPCVPANEALCHCVQAQLFTSLLAARRPKVLSSQDNAGEDCAVFVTPDGSIQEVMCADYGFRSGFGRLYQGGDGEIPKNFFQLVGATIPPQMHIRVP